MSGRKREENSATRKRILHVAERLFAQKGFDGSGMEEVARKAGIAKSVIYYHFKNKKQILDTLIHSLVDEAIEIQQGPTLGSDLALNKSYDDLYAAIKPIAAKVLRFLEQRKDTVRIILAQSFAGQNDAPVFAVLDKCMEAAAGERDECCPGITASKAADLMLDEFFMNLLPIACFVVFKDAWCRKYGLSGDDAEERYIQMYARYRIKAYLPWLLGT